MTDNAKPIEAAARAICRRRLIVSQERTGLPILSDAHLQEAIDTTWQDFAEDARVALEAAASVERPSEHREPLEGGQ